jgi:hypothetical protein
MHWPSAQRPAKNRNRFVKGLSNHQCPVDSRSLREHNANGFTCRRPYVAVIHSVSNDISGVIVA